MGIVASGLADEDKENYKELIEDFLGKLNFILTNSKNYFLIS